MKILKSLLVSLLSVFLAVNPALNELLWALDFPLNAAKTYALSAQKEASSSPSAFVTSQAAVKVPAASSQLTQAAEKKETLTSDTSSALEAREKVLNDHRSQNAFINRRASAALRQDPAVVSAFDVTADQKFDTQDTQAIATSIKEKKEYNQAMDLNGDQTVDRRDQRLMHDAYDFGSYSTGHQAEVVRKLAPEYSAALLTGISDLGQVNRATTVMTHLKPAEGSAILDEMGTTENGTTAAAGILDNLSNFRTRSKNYYAAKLVSGMENTQSAANILQVSETSTGSRILSNWIISTEKATGILNTMAKTEEGTQSASNLISDMYRYRAPTKAATIVNTMEKPAAAGVLTDMMTTTAANILSHKAVTEQNAAGIMNEMAKTEAGTDAASGILESMYQKRRVTRAAGIVSAMEEPAAATVLSSTNVAASAALFKDTKITVDKASALVTEMVKTDEGKTAASGVIERMYDASTATAQTKAVSIVNTVENPTAAKVLTGISTETSAKILDNEAITLEKASGIVGEMVKTEEGKTAAVNVIEKMSGTAETRAVGIVNTIDKPSAAAIVTGLETETGAKILSSTGTSVENATGIVSEMVKSEEGKTAAGTIIGQMADSAEEKTIGIVNSLDKPSAAAILTEAGAETGEKILSNEGITVENATGIVAEMVKSDEGKAAAATIIEQMTGSDEEKAVGVVNGLDKPSAAAVMTAVTAEAGAKIFSNEAVTKETAVGIADEMAKSETGIQATAKIFEEMVGAESGTGVAKAATIINGMAKPGAGAVIGAMDPEAAAKIITDTSVTAQNAAGIIAGLGASETGKPKAVAVLGAIEDPTAIVNELGKDKESAKVAAAYLEQNLTPETIEKASAVVSGMDKASAATIVSSMSAQAASTLLTGGKITATETTAIMNEMAKTSEGAQAAASVISGLFGSESIGDKDQASDMLAGLDTAASAAVKNALGTETAGQIEGYSTVNSAVATSKTVNGTFEVAFDEAPDLTGVEKMYAVITDPETGTETKVELTELNSTTSADGKTISVQVTDKDGKTNDTDKFNVRIVGETAEGQQVDLSETFIVNDPDNKGFTAKVLETPETATDTVQAGTQDTATPTGKTIELTSGIKLAEQSDATYRDESGNKWITVGEGQFRQVGFSANTEITLSDGKVLKSTSAYETNADGSFKTGTMFTDEQGNKWVTTDGSQLRQLSYPANSTINLQNGSTLTSVKAYELNPDGTMPKGVEFTDQNGNKWVSQDNGQFAQVANVPAGTNPSKQITLNNGKVLTPRQDYTIGSNGQPPAGTEFVDQDGTVWVSQGNGNYAPKQSAQTGSITLSNGKQLTPNQDYGVDANGQPLAGAEFTDQDGVVWVSQGGGQFAPVSSKTVGSTTLQLAALPNANNAAQKLGYVKYMSSDATLVFCWDDGQYYLWNDSAKSYERVTDDVYKGDTGPQGLFEIKREDGSIIRVCSDGKGEGGTTTIIVPASLANEQFLSPGIQIVNTFAKADSGGNQFLLQQSIDGDWYYQGWKLDIVSKGQDSKGMYLKDSQGNTYYVNATTNQVTINTPAQIGSYINPGNYKYGEDQVLTVYPGGSYEIKDSKGTVVGSGTAGSAYALFGINAATPAQNIPAGNVVAPGEYKEGDLTLIVNQNGSYKIVDTAGNIVRMDNTPDSASKTFVLTQTTVTPDPSSTTTTTPVDTTGVVSGIGAAIGGAAGGTLGNIIGGPAGGALGTAAGTVLGGIAGSAAGTVITTVTGIAGTVMGTIPTASSVGASVGGAIGNAVLGPVGGVLGSATGGIIGAAADAVVGLVTGSPSSPSSNYGSTGSSSGSSGSSSSGTSSASMGSVGSAVGGAVGGSVGGAIGGSVGASVGSSVGSAVGGAVGAAASAVSSAASAAASAVSGAASAIGGAIGGFFGGSSSSSSSGSSSSSSSGSSSSGSSSSGSSSSGSSSSGSSSSGSSSSGSSSSGSSSSGSSSGGSSSGGSSSGGSSSGGGGTVICTELHRQGYLKDDVYAADAAYGMLQDKELLAGYHYWAIPVVSLMQRSKLATKIVKIFALPWAKEMAYQMGASKQGSIVGKAVMAIGYPLCRSIGRRIIKSDSIIALNLLSNDRG